ncbi:MAG: restriction endonuclease [Acidobacteriia bacterium]|nr:restriction endonuclease [Terriglobia bacterium]
MDLRIPTAGLDRYKSASQRARVGTEAWGELNLFCVNCTSDSLDRTRTNTPAVDFTCPKCAERFQLKSQKRRLGNTLTDGAYEKMQEAIETDKTPNILALHYEPERWSVSNLLLVPRFSYTLSVIKKRNPLSPTAERHDWVGCSIMLGDIPAEAKIPLITNGSVHPATQVRRQYNKLRDLGKMSVEARGWTLDVLRVVHSLGKRDFFLHDVYDFEHDLFRLHPANRHIQQKIRQQLQELRDMGILQFLGRGRYRLL